jgi:hypothetical protein
MRYRVCLYTTELLTGGRMPTRILLLSIIAMACGCAPHTHTLESTSHMTRNELLALCEDLQMRATMDCEWNMEEQQSSVPNQQTWEINCRARRDSARESFDNVCHPSRFRQAEIVRKPEQEDPQR